jgi:hypothetical protein
MIAIKGMKMPNDCYHCPMCHIFAWDFPVRYFCNVENRLADVQGEKEKPEWCPLEELPDERQNDA